MSKRAAIRNQGDKAESRFVELVPGSRLSEVAKRGDAMTVVDGDEVYIEVKECHAAAGKNGTINQVRAIKYICCVIWAPGHGCWYVVSPDQLVALAATKERGQHTEIAFESMNFSLHQLAEGFCTTCDDEGLAEAVLEAVRSGRRNAELGEAMRELLEEIQDLKQRYVARVEEHLSH